MITLLAATFLGVTLTILFVIVAILLVFMVVITPSQEGGMAAAFGGMGSDSFFGTKAHQHINKFTVFLAVSLLVLTVFINLQNAATPPTRAGIIDRIKPPAAPTPELPAIPPPNK